MTKIYIADFETTPFDKSKKDNYLMKARFICFLEITTNEKLFFNLEKDGIKPLKEFILSLCNQYNCRIYFHNLRFDIAFLYNLLPKREYKYKIIKNGSKLIQFKIYKEYKRKDKNKERIEQKTVLDIRDSLALLLSSEQKLGLAVNNPKKEMDYFQKEITTEFIEYCHNDCLIIKLALEKVYQFCSKFFNYEIEIKDLPLTIASLGKRLLHHLLIQKYGKDIINRLYSKNTLELESKLREYYFGGRVEVFDFNCCLDGYYNDFNSMYPSIMFENKFPLNPYYYREFSEIENEKIYQSNEKVFGCLCEIIENQQIPLIPIKMLNDKILFPNGKKLCFLFRKEIDYLRQLNQQVKILELWFCSSYLFIFKDYIEITYSIKQQFDDTTFEYLFTKILMNAVYGKFAEKKEKESIFILHFINIREITEKELENIEITEKGYIKRTTKFHNELKTNIIISMMITAYSRLKLYQTFVQKSNGFYVDSDSIVSKELIENSKELGHLKPEFQFVKFQSLGCKEYIILFKDKEQKLQHLVKMKGFGKLSTNNFSEFVANYYSGKKQNRMVGFLESFKRNLPFEMVLVYDKFKQNVYDKRWINNDLTTKPFDLENDDFQDLLINNEYMIQKIINSYQFDLL